MEWMKATARVGILAVAFVLVGMCRDVTMNVQKIIGDDP